MSNLPTAPSAYIIESPIALQSKGHKPRVPLGGVLDSALAPHYPQPRFTCSQSMGSSGFSCNICMIAVSTKEDTPFWERYARASASLMPAILVYHV